MTNNPKYPAKTAELVFANGLLAYAAHAFVYQNLGLRGQFVLGHAAIGVGVISAIIALWIAVHYFRRVPLRHGLRNGLVSVFAVIVALCMSSQLGLWHLNATNGAAYLSIIAVGLLAWPVIAGAAAFFQEIQKQEKSGPTTVSTATNEPANGGYI